MDMLFPLFAMGIALVTGLALMANAKSRPLWLRISALASAAALMTIGYTGFAELLGRAKPASLEWAERNLEEATVLASNLREGEAIYLWLQLDDAEGPMAYLLPWSKKAARQLKKAEREAKSRGTRVRVKRPFTRDPKTPEPQFHAEAQTALPEKTLAGRTAPPS